MGSIVIGFVWSLSSSFLHLLMLLSGIWKDVYHSGHRFDTSDWFFLLLSAHVLRTAQSRTFWR